MAITDTKPIGRAFLIDALKSYKANILDPAYGGVIFGYYKSADGKFYKTASYTDVITGEDQKIYVSLDTNLVYRLDGTSYVLVSDIIDDTTSSTTTVYSSDKVDDLLGDKVDVETGKSLVSNTDITQITTNKNSITSLDDNQQIKNKVGTTLELDTNEGGIRLNRVYGNTHKSKNLIQESNYLGLTNMTYENGVFKANANNVTYCEIQYTNSDILSKLLKLVGKTCTVSFDSQPSGKSYHVNVVIFGTFTSGGSYKQFSPNQGNYATFTIPSDMTAVTKLIIRTFQNPTGITDTTSEWKNLMFYEGSYDGSYEPYGIISVGEMGWFDGDLGQGGVDGNTRLANTSTYRVHNMNLIKVSKGDIIHIDADVIQTYCPLVFPDEKDSVAYVYSPPWTSVDIDSTIVGDGYLQLVYKISDTDVITPTTAGNIKITINSIPYACVVKEHGKNLVDIEPFTCSVSGTRTVTINLDTPLENGKTYTFSWKEKNNNVSAGLNLLGGASTVANGASKKMTYNVSQLYFYVPNATGNTCTIYDVVVNEGTKVIPYGKDTISIPLNDNLRSVNSVKDYIDETGEHHLIGSVDLGSLSWYSNTTKTSGKNRYKAPYTLIKGDTSDEAMANILCYKYGSVTSGDTYRLVEGIAANHTDIKIYDESLCTVGAADFKAAMSGIMLYYELETPTVTPLTSEQLKAIHSLKAYKDKTYIDTADVYAKATFDVDYSKVQSEALENENDIAIVNRVHEDDVSQNLLDTMNYVWTAKDDTLTLTNNDDGSLVFNGTNTQKNAMRYTLSLGKGMYTISGCPKAGSNATYRMTVTDGTDALAYDYGNGATFTLNGNTIIYVWIDIMSGCNPSNLVFKPMLEVGTVVHPYKSYKNCYATRQTDTEVDDLKMLGWTVPREMSIQNYIDANGVFHQRVGRVDLGTVTWQYEPDTRFKFVISDMKVTKSGTRESDGLFCCKYSASTTGSDKTFFKHHPDSAASDANYIFLYDSSYSNISEIKTAMSGVYLYYELATEVTKNVDGYEAIVGLNSSVSALNTRANIIAGQFGQGDFNELIPDNNNWHQAKLYRVYGYASDWQNAPINSYINGLVLSCGLWAKDTNMLQVYFGNNEVHIRLSTSNSWTKILTTDNRPCTVTGESFITLTKDVEYVCPSDGYFRINVGTTGGNVTGYINGYAMMLLQQANTGNSIFVSKGTRIKYSSTTSTGYGHFVKLIL